MTASSTTAAISNINAGYTYVFTITAMTDGLNSPSASYSFIQTLAPAAPTYLAVTKTSIKNTLTWVAGHDNGAAIDYYQVEKYNAATSAWDLYQDNVVGTSLILGAGLTAGSSY